MGKAGDIVVFSDLGEAGLLCEYPRGPLNIERQKRIWFISDLLRNMQGICEIVPGMNNLAVFFDPETSDPGVIMDRVRELWRSLITGDKTGRLLDVPVVYGGDCGPDLEALADRAGMTPEEFATRHSNAEYIVYALGSQPGFGYLGGLPEDLATPRRDVIHPRVEAGSVIIGGAQTAVQSCTTPSGWHIIGRTGLTFFDPAAEPPNLLAPGDRVRFQIKEMHS